MVDSSETDNIYDAKFKVDDEGKIQEISISGNEHLNNIVQDYMCKPGREFKIDELENIIGKYCRYYECQDGF